jgi:ABC-type dipeptide/oligopeptide/nickel transport system permease subunit
LAGSDTKIAPARGPAKKPLSGEEAWIAESETRTLWQDAWRRLRKNKIAMASSLFIIFMLLVAIMARLIAPYPYDQMIMSDAFQTPTAKHLLGTDDLGRDVLSRIIYGAQTSLSVGLGVTLIVLVIGVTMGLLSGFFGGWVDMVIMRLTDIVFAFPGLLFAILVMAVLGQSIVNVFIALSLTGWAGLSRIVRGQVLGLKEREFVEAARSLGVRDLRIVARHVLPNVLSPVIVSATMDAGGFILSEASLSFLGIGVKPPFPSWGGMISSGTQTFMNYPHMICFPSLALAILILTFNFLGDDLRDALDPRLKNTDRG